MNGGLIVRGRWVVVGAILALLGWDVANGQCIRVSQNYTGTPFLGRTIGLVAKDGVSENDLEKAVKFWRQGCDVMFTNGQLPRLLANQTGDRNIYVFRHDTIAPKPRTCGLYTRDQIHIWAFTMLNEELVPCPIFERLIAHEIGHALALGDAPADPACRGHMMSQIVLGSNSLPEVIEGECRLAALTNTPQSTDSILLASGSAQSLVQPSALASRASRKSDKDLVNWMSIFDTIDGNSRSSQSQSLSSNEGTWLSHRPSQPWQWDREK